MGVTSEWFIAERVIHTYGWSHFTLDDIQHASDTARRLIHSGQSPVHHIIDLRHVKRYPTNIRAIMDASQVFREPAHGWAVYIIQDPMLRFLAATTTQFHRAPFSTFTKSKEALAFLKSEDSTLPAFPAYRMPDRTASTV